jgi:hypothetical protein
VSKGINPVVLEGEILQVEGFNHHGKVFRECFPLLSPFQLIILAGILANMVTGLAGVYIHIYNLLGEISRVGGRKMSARVLRKVF